MYNRLPYSRTKRLCATEESAFKTVSTGNQTCGSVKSGQNPSRTALRFPAIGQKLVAPYHSGSDRRHPDGSSTSIKPSYKITGTFDPHGSPPVTKPSEWRSGNLSERVDCSPNCLPPQVFSGFPPVRGFLVASAGGWQDLHHAPASRRHDRACRRSSIAHCILNLCRLISRDQNTIRSGLHYRRPSSSSICLYSSRSRRVASRSKIKYFISRRSCDSAS